MSLRSRSSNAIVLGVLIALPMLGAALTLLQVFQDGLGGVDGLAGALSVAASPERRHVYVAGPDDAILSSGAPVSAFAGVEFAF